MGASRNTTFRTLDSAAATVGYGWGALVQRELARNLNHLNENLVQPVLSRGYEMLDPFDDGIMARSRHSRQVNAPRGAWTWIVPLTEGLIAPGTEQIDIDIYAEMGGSASALVQPVTSRSRFNRAGVSGDAGIYTLSGTGAAATYPTSATAWRTSIAPDPDGRDRFGLAVQTSGFYVEEIETADEVTEREITANNSDFYANYKQSGIRSLDRWARVEQATNLLHAAVEDNSGSSFTDLTTLGSTGAAETVYPAVPAISDAVYFGMPHPFAGLKTLLTTQGAGTHTVTWQYYDGNSWETITHLGGNGQGIVNFREAASSSTYRYNVWDIPTDWAPVTIGTNTFKAFYVRAKLTAFTDMTTIAQVDRVYALGPTRMPWTRIMGGIYYYSGTPTTYRLYLAPPRSFAAGAESQGDVYITGYADPLDIYAVHLDGVAMTLRVP